MLHGMKSMRPTNSFESGGWEEPWFEPCDGLMGARPIQHGGQATSRHLRHAPPVLQTLMLSLNKSFHKHDTWHLIRVTSIQRLGCRASMLRAFPSTQAQTDTRGYNYIQ